MQINTHQILDKQKSLVISINDNNLETLLSEEQKAYIKQQQKDKKDLITIDKQSSFIFVVADIDKKKKHLTTEAYRKLGHQIYNQLNNAKIEAIQIQAFSESDYTLALTEGICLSSYRFNKYFTNDSKKQNHLNNIHLIQFEETASLEELKHLTDAVFWARNLVNEPLSYLTAEQLGEEIKQSAQKYGFSANVLGKKQIESLKMGGLLAVNKGSFDPPTFSILEWKPENCKNDKPVVLVGKGVVFDTGGLSLKPTSGSMDEMKSDMAGAAAVVGAFQACVANQLPIHLIALIPATDNRPGNQAYAPQDVIKMYNGTTVEVLNTDAEGRMILADALAYAQKYEPELVIDLATLTGAAYVAVGPHAIVSMGTAEEQQKKALEQSGEAVYERLVEFPFWEEYGELILSDVADIKNIGGRYGGAITAGKFLEHFTNYPYIHLDIAGPAYLLSKDEYRPKGGTGVGVRLLYHFLKNYTK